VARRAGIAPTRALAEMGEFAKSLIWKFHGICLMNTKNCEYHSLYYKNGKSLDLRTWMQLCIFTSLMWCVLNRKIKMTDNVS
jgi:hypothetical protein